MKTLFIVCALVCFSLIECFSQEIQTKNLDLTGNLGVDTKLVLNEYVNSSPVIVLGEPTNKKSPVLAGLMSAVVPGSGEIYTGEYLKGAIFLLAEGGLIAAAVVYDNKADDKTNEFQNFADEHWNVADYAQYLMDHKTELGIPEDCNIDPINNDPNLNPWERLNWDQLNECESAFSHHLPRYGTQQYYELIGKYTQYCSGWDEFDPSGGFRNVPQIMRDYAAMRGEANDLYNVASKLVIGIYINHFLSALDAVWSAISYNKDLSVNMRVQNLKIADRYEFAPTVNFQYQF